MVDTAIQHQWTVKYRSRFVRSGNGQRKHNKVTADTLANARFIAQTQCPKDHEVEAIARTDVNDFFPCKGKGAIKREEAAKQETS